MDRPSGVRARVAHVVFAAVVTVGMLTAGCGFVDSQARPAPAEPVAADRKPWPQPRLPDKAVGTSVAAAESFVRHYVDLLNYAMNTGDTREFDRASLPSCDGCADYTAMIEKAYQRGGYFETDGWSVDSITTSAAPAGRSLALDVEAIAAPVVLRERRGGDLKRSARTPVSFRVVLYRAGQHWQVYSLAT